MLEEIKKRPINVYALVNPLNNKIFYVGATSSPENVRLSAHCSEIGNNAKGEIICSILDAGERPILMILEQDVPINAVSKRENFYIKKYKLRQLKSGYSESYKGKTFIFQEDNCISIRLGELLEPLLAEAKRQDRSLHWLIISILKQQPFVQEYLQNKKQ